ncbi:MAG: aromatic ring-hydroxylating dioxygenase subunit alpha [Gloeomargarita sp. HHBFW_bins_162]
MERQRFLLPADYYTNPQLIPLEQERIWRRSWLYLGSVQQVQTPGSVWATTCAGISILITRDAQGELHGFYNLCPHRAMELCPEMGVFSMKQLICPYHAWVYDLAGQLVAAARQKQFGADFACQDYPLYPIRVAVWQDLLFVSFDVNVMPLSAYLAPIPQTLGQYAVPGFQHLSQQKRSVACNWKVYHDNTLCDYHVAIAHPKTLNRLQGAVRNYHHRFGEYVNALVTPVPDDWFSQHPARPDLLPENQTHFYTFAVFPNLHLLALPNGTLICLRIDPVTVDKCQVVTDVYGVPEWVGDLEAVHRELNAFMQEDVVLAESVQRGYRSGVYQPGPVHRLEARIFHHQNLILNSLKTPLTH